MGTDAPIPHVGWCSPALIFGAVSLSAMMSSQRAKNYAFDYSHVLSMKGNTAIFLLYAAARLSVSFHHYLRSECVFAHGFSVNVT